MTDKHEKMENSAVRAIQWMSSSGIQLDDPPRLRGGVHAWYDTSREEYSFIYSEITGYATTFYAYLCKLREEERFATLLRRAADYLVNVAFNEGGGILCRFFPSSETWLNNLCAFDNGVCLNALVNAYKITGDERYLSGANSIKETLLTKLAKPDGTFYAKLLLPSGELLDSDQNWSTQSGSYQAKLAMGLLNLHSVTSDASLITICRKLCDYALTQQEQCGRFVTSRKDASTFVHPHCYTIEGLLAAGRYLGYEEYLEAADKGIRWILSLQMENGGFPAFFRNNRSLNVDSCDINAQVIRAWTLLNKMGYETASQASIERAIERLLSSQILSSDKRSDGGFCIGEAWFADSLTPRYHLNSWATMMSTQALQVLSQGVDPLPFLLV
jgi:uncharacterized protein YyaL (SSP411 family)